MAEIPASLWIGVGRVGRDPQPGRPTSIRRRTGASRRWPPPSGRAISTWHPMGQLVAFTLDRDTSDMWVIDVDGGHPVRLTTGRTLAAFWEDGGPACRRTGADRLTADGKVISRPVSGRAAEGRSATGRRRCGSTTRRLLIAVDRGRHGTRRPRSPWSTSDDPWPVLLASGDGDRGEAKLSPDGTRVASTLLPRDDRNCTSLHVTDLATGRRLARGRHTWPQRPIARPGHPTATCWPSPTSAGLARGLPHRRRRLGSGRQLTDGGHNFADLRWSPDGDPLSACAPSWRDRPRRRRRGERRRRRAGRGRHVVVTGGWPTGRSSRPRVAHDGAPPVPGRPAGTITELFAPTPAAGRGGPARRPGTGRATCRSTDRGPRLALPPAGRASAEHPVPAIVNPHGGPTDVRRRRVGRRGPVLHRQGLRWFLLNFRGSTSWGRDHEHANHGDWGVGDTKDCLAAHDFLSALTWWTATASPSSGRSYGSYMALCSVVDDPQHR